MMTMISNSSNVRTSPPPFLLSAPSPNGARSGARSGTRAPALIQQETFFKLRKVFCILAGASFTCARAASLRRGPPLGTRSVQVIARRNMRLFPYFYFEFFFTTRNTYKSAVDSLLLLSDALAL